QLLLRRMENVTNREAFMTSVLVLYYPDGDYVFGEGSTRGKITRVRRGFNGFGYDSVFYVDELGKTFGESTDIEKQSVSHRTKAVADLFSKL
ncbi:MAG: non-canonical purine NTP pyrophosphatase, partial [Clostridia bacterium]